MFQKIKAHQASQKPFVFYCKPNSTKVVALLQRNDKLYDLQEHETGFAFVSFDGTKRFVFPENQSDIYYETIVKADYAIPKDNFLPIDESVRIEFETLVAKGLKAIENQELSKVVLSRKEIVGLKSFDLEFVFHQLISQYTTAFKYAVYHPKIGFWMGATPEQFLKIEGKSIKTVALAGTKLNDATTENNWSSKEINEQQIVTDYIVENLKAFSNQIAVTKPYDFKAGALVHIKTDIEATVSSGHSIVAIIDSLHPTPAVCGFPKQAAKAFILQNEAYDREFYAGFLGEWNKNFETMQADSSDLFVNLRCMKVTKKQADIYIGCGINKGSQPEKEFLETVNKSQTMKKVLHY